MTDLLADPFIQSSILPLLLGLVLTGVLRLAAGPRIAAAGVVAAFILLFIWVIGAPAFPPPSAMGKLFWAAVAGLILALALDLWRPPAPLRGGLLLLWLAAALVWITGAALSGPADWAVLGLALAAAIWATLAPAPFGEQQSVSAAATAFAWAIAVGGVALIGASASLAQLGLGLSAALGGFLLWNWPVARYGWGAAGRVAQGVAVLLAAVLGIFSTAPAVALLPALLSPVVAGLAARVPLPAGVISDVVRPALAVILALLPALAALGLALLLTGGEASPY